MPGKMRVETTVNGEAVEFLCEPRQSLLECLRDILSLTGTKEGCNDGNCGACTVIMDGRIVTSCLVLGVEAEGSQITTIEGIAGAGRLHPIQQAFLEGHELRLFAFHRAARGLGHSFQHCGQRALRRAAHEYRELQSLHGLYTVRSDTEQLSDGAARVSIELLPERRPRARGGGRSQDRDHPDRLSHRL